jgi:TP53 regulating kinase and related kinases
VWLGVDLRLVVISRYQLQPLFFSNNQQPMTNNQEPAPWQQGSESKIYIMIWPTPTICKQRFRKSWRLPQLDTSLTQRRILQEVKSLAKVKSIVHVPNVSMVDWNGGCIYMQHFSEPRLRDVIGSMNETQVIAVGAMIGSDLAAMHDIDIIHGTPG